MQIYYQLVLTGYILTPVFASLIIVPWLLGRTDLVSAWSLFMLGSINFISLGLIQNGRAISGHEYGEYVNEFIAAVLVFYTLLALVYLWPRRAKRTLLPRWIKWPQDHFKGMAFVAVSLGTISLVMAVAAPGFQGSQIIYVVRTPLAIAGFASAMHLLWRSPTRPDAWLISAFCFATALAVTLTWGTGRRELLALLVTVPAIGYWVRFRYQKRKKTLIWLSALGFAGLVVITSYQSFRHDVRQEQASTTRERVMTRVSKFPSAIVETVSNWSWIGGSSGPNAFDTQNAIDAGLLTMIALDKYRSIERYWFHTPVYIAVNPVPRSVWPGKPMGLGKTLPLAYGNTRISWGPSIIGHCFYDGGWPVVFMYAFALGVALRWFDASLASDPTNPWPSVLLLSVAGHIIGLSRGDIGNFGVQIVGMIIIIPIVLNCLRPLTGTRHAGIANHTLPHFRQDAL